MSGETPVAAYEVGHTVRARAPAPSPRQAAALRGLATVVVPSKFNVTVDLHDGRKAVYNTFSTAIVVLQPAAWQRYCAPGARHHLLPEAASSTLGSLHARGFVVSEGIDEKELVRHHFQRDRHEPRSSLGVNILPTMACNLQCPYCFQGVTQVTTKPRIMARDIEDAIVGYLEAQAAGRHGLAVSWFGGEPLVGLRTITRLSPRLIEFCDREKMDYRAVLTTNGVLMDRAAVDALVEARVGMAQISIDVPGDTRNDKKGRDTRDAVLDNLVYAAEKMRIQMRINMTRDEEADWEQLFDAIVRRNLQSRLQAYVANVVQAEYSRRSDVGSEVSHDDYVEVMRRQRRRAREIGLRMDSPVAPNCGAGCGATSSSSITIDPDGLLYKCPEDAGRPDRAYGSVVLKSVMRPDNLLPWMSYDWFSHEACWDCALLPQCAGGCPHRRLFQSQLPNDAYCYWAIRGDLESRIRDTATGLLSR